MSAWPVHAGRPFRRRRQLEEGGRGRPVAAHIAPDRLWARGDLFCFAFKKFVPSPEMHEPPMATNRRPWWVRGILILTCTGVSFAHGSNDGQKGIGLIMLILIGLVPVELRHEHGPVRPSSSTRSSKRPDHMQDILGDPKVRKRLAATQPESETIPAFSEEAPKDSVPDHAQPIRIARSRRQHGARIARAPCMPTGRTRTLRPISMTSSVGKCEPKRC